MAVWAQGIDVVYAEAGAPPRGAAYDHVAPFVRWRLAYQGHDAEALRVAIETMSHRYRLPRKSELVSPILLPGDQGAAALLTKFK